ncbi:PLP-dependent aminotransferase family protein [Vibrio ostreicida]|uniref:PLP-dependent aminotransferase family protein n=1 Tax=Vibrio ostreicida TaxID=526588 RepID=A0ABT8BTS2_9VIBR|nr:PLP-dependent aminotransferase family protein [Vibrio ostreicida]MDN3610530.1 PLP-dependent aminotransferase family protein [Vibrio ostreicida]NPD07469.1 PLP-dependent aminotransferase family protein [Vibrio ostreicida]
MSESKFNQIADTIEARIDQGDYPINFKLPPHRALADELSTTPATVAKAYKLLADKGRVESFVGRGTFVCGDTSLTQAIQPQDDQKEFNFSILQPCLQNNIPSLKAAMMNVSAELTADSIGYAEHSGHHAHREAGVAWARAFGLKGGNANNTLLTHGAQHGLSLLIHALTEPGDSIAVEALTYPGILAIASLSGRQVVSVAMDQQGLMADELEQAIAQHDIKAVITLPSHQNPTGITMPILRRQEIAKVINDNEIWLIEDDIYGFLNQRPLPAISNYAPDYAFHLSGLSKAISPALRCGFMKVPESQVGVISAHIRANIWLSSPLNYMAASHLITSGEAFKISATQRDIADRRQRIARDILADVQCTASGYHLWLPLPAGWAPERFIIEAKDRGLIVSSGSYFDASGQGTRHIRLSLMSITEEGRFRQGLSQLKVLLDSPMSAAFPM